MAVRLPEKLSWYQIEYEANIGKIPADLLPIVSQGEKVLRFVQKDNPPGIIFDTVARHLLRVDNYLFEIGATRQTRRMSWVHDLAEITLQTRRGIFHDTTAPDKRADERLDQEIAQTELEVATEILSPADLILFYKFEAMKSWLKSRNDIEPGFETIIAGLVDTIDGNMCFHTQVTASLTAGTTQPESWPQTQLDFTFNWSDMVKSRSRDLRISTKRMEILSGLVDLHLDLTRDRWQTVPPEKIPQRISSRLYAK